MRSTFSLFVLIGVSILIFANLSFYIPFQISTITGDPVLPDIPFDYTKELPDHLQSVWISPDHMNSLHSITDEGATLGRVLFYDKVLSAMNDISCASCHKQEFSFADNTALSLGTNSLTSRNTPHLNDLGWANRFAFFWDMRIANFNEAISLPLTSPNELGNDNIDELIERMEATNYYPILFNDAFGSTDITEDKIKEAIVQFISSFTTFESKIDLVQKGQAELTEIESKGQIVYQQHCNSCHNSPSPGILNIFQNTGGFELAFDVYQDAFYNGLPLEVGDIGTGAWHPEYTEKFKIVTLRNIMVTAPYMHDGRFETMEEVIEHYDSGITGNVDGEFNDLTTGGIEINEEEKSNLISFLETFTDESVLTMEKFSDPFSTATGLVDANNSLESQINFFPNPTKGQIQMNWVDQNKSLISIKCYNDKGQLIRQFSSLNNEFSTDITDFPTGVYFFNFFRNNEIWQVKKVIKI